jgi:hypothetical protein
VANDGEGDRPGDLLARLADQVLRESLAAIEAVVAGWRAGELGTRDAHVDIVRSALRAERMAARADGPAAGDRAEEMPSLLREAFDRGLLDRAEFVRMTGCEPEVVELWSRLSVLT